MLLSLAGYPFTATQTLTEEFQGHKDFCPCQGSKSGPSEPLINTVKLGLATTSWGRPLAFAGHALAPPSYFAI